MRDRTCDFQTSGITKRHEHVGHLPGILAQEPAVADRGVAVHAEEPRNGPGPVAADQVPRPENGLPLKD
jgi:hypothetical protein